MRNSCGAQQKQEPVFLVWCKSEIKLTTLGREVGWMVKPSNVEWVEAFVPCGKNEISELIWYERFGDQKKQKPKFAVDCLCSPHNCSTDHLTNGCDVYKKEKRSCKVYKINVCHCKTCNFRRYWSRFRRHWRRGNLSSLMCDRKEFSSLCRIHELFDWE